MRRNATVRRGALLDRSVSARATPRLQRIVAGTFSRLPAYCLYYGSTSPGVPLSRGTSPSTLASPGQGVPFVKPSLNCVRGLLQRPPAAQPAPPWSEVEQTKSSPDLERIWGRGATRSLNSSIHLSFIDRISQHCRALFRFQKAPQIA